MPDGISETYQPPALPTQLFYVFAWGLVHLLMQLFFLGRHILHFFRRPDNYPDMIKHYNARRKLPVRIFYPKSHDQASGVPLPVLFTVHGGAFSMFSATDDDQWNRHFADTQGTLVIGLNHSLAPFSRYPVPIHDLEAVLLSLADDEELVFDRQRTAIGGSSSGATLAFAVAQLESIRTKLDLKAAFSSCGALQLSLSPHFKTMTRHYKPVLGSQRGAPRDLLAVALSPIQWSYTPSGTPVEDPLYSPFYAEPKQLPPHLFFIAAELDLLAHEAWQMACRHADCKIPDISEKVGRPHIGKEGALELEDDRFAFEHVQRGPDGSMASSVKWLLVPDARHAFDWRSPDALAGDAKTIRDAYSKTTETIDILGTWLREIVWKIES